MCLRLRARSSAERELVFTRRLFFHPSTSAGSLGVKSISGRIGEKFMRRCRPAAGRFGWSILRPFLACADSARVSWPLSRVFESRSVCTGCPSQSRAPSSQPTHFTRVNRAKIYRRPGRRPFPSHSVSFARRIRSRALARPRSFAFPSVAS